MEEGQREWAEGEEEEEEGEEEEAKEEEEEEGGLSVLHNKHWVYRHRVA